MAFTSFTVRNTVSDGGSALRRTNVNQNASNPDGSGDSVQDSGLRADGYFVPVPREFLESTFSANVYNRTEIELEWELNFSIVDPLTDLTAEPKPVEVLIKASNYGEPITAGDGDFVIKVTSSDFRLNYKDDNNVYIKPGNWVYYSMFVKYEDNTGGAFYERVAILSVQIPRDFNSTEDLWSRIPAYYRSLDEQQAPLSVTGYTPLYGFVELFGWELDKIRTTIYDTMRINDPDVIHSSAIDALADQSGIEFTKDALGTSKLRAILNNIGYLRRTKGTTESVKSYISALSGCGVNSAINFDDENWTSINLFSNTLITGVAYGDGKWVAVGHQGKTSTSLDGKTWSSVTTVGNTRDLMAVAYGDGFWIAVGRSENLANSSCIYRSADGVNWTPVFSTPSSFTSSYFFRDVAYGDGVWVAVGQAGPSASVLCTSLDGINWTVKSSGITGTYLTKVAYGNNKWIATSMHWDGKFSVSTDNGATWSAVSPSSLTAGPQTAVYYSDEVWLIAVGNLIFRSLDNGVTWIASEFPIVGATDFFDFVKLKDIWLAVDETYVYASEDANYWYIFYNPLSSGGSSIAVDGNTMIIAYQYKIFINNYFIEFNVHPMRVNLFSDPFFKQGDNSPTVPDTGNIQRIWTNLDAGGREYGWGVYTSFSSTPPSTITVSNDNDKLTVTLPPMSGTALVLIYSRGSFIYNNNLKYYFSGISSHSYVPRFVSALSLSGMETTPPPPDVFYYDDWNDFSIPEFPVFKDFLTNDTRSIVSSVPSPTPLPSPVSVVPVFKFNVELSSSEPTVIVLEKPMVEYRNSSGEFFSGNDALGGFIQDPTGSLGAGAYDYHWGQNAGGSPHTDFSYYTLDFHRVKSVVDNIVENYIVPVNVVKNTDYVINWDVLE